MLDPYSFSYLVLVESSSFFQYWHLVWRLLQSFGWFDCFVLPLVAMVLGKASGKDTIRHLHMISVCSV